MGIHSIYLTPEGEKDFVELKQLIDANNADKRRKKVSISEIFGNAIKAYVKNIKIVPVPEYLKEPIDKEPAAEVKEYADNVALSLDIAKTIDKVP